jgi:GTPase SAR1 family protein
MDHALRKLCVIGDYRVGKTRLVHALTGCTAPRPTAGVHLYRWASPGNGQDFCLFDAAGRSSLDSIGQSFLSGALGFALVADADPARIDTALRLYSVAQSLVGRRPGVLMVNKTDVGGSRPPLPELPPDLPVFFVSAATGDGVQAAFSALAALAVREQPVAEPPTAVGGIVGVS